MVIKDIIKENKEDVFPYTSVYIVNKENKVFKTEVGRLTDFALNMKASGYYDGVIDLLLIKLEE